MYVHASENTTEKLHLQGYPLSYLALVRYIETGLSFAFENKIFEFWARSKPNLNYLFPTSIVNEYKHENEFNNVYKNA